MSPRLTDARPIVGSVLGKVRRQERGAGHVERRLVALGARAPRALEDPAAWLAEALETIAPQRIRHRGNHRYLFPLGRNGRARAAVALGYREEARPKLIDAG